MADDTRQQESPPPENAEEPQVRRPRRPKPKHEFPKTQAGKLWEAFGNPDEPVNELSGGTINSAGGRPPEVTWRDAFKFGQLSKPGQPAWYKTQCSRDALLVGIGSGGAVGGLRFIFKGLSTVGRSANYAVGTFVLAASGMYYWCDRRRREEAQGMAYAVAGMKMLNEKRARERAVEEAAEAAMQAAEEEKRKSKSWYNFW